MNQKGFTNIILVIIVVVLVGVGAYLVSTRTNWDSGKEYFYYYYDKKIPLKFLGMKDGRPHFVTQDSTKAEVFLTDEFIVKIKSGVTREELDALNRKYSTSIVENIYGTDDEFVLTVKSDPSNNALDMANLYHNQTIIEWAEPNFIQLSVQSL